MSSEVSDLSHQRIDERLSNVSKAEADDDAFELQNFEFQVTSAFDIDNVPNLTPSLQRLNSHASDPTRENLLLEQRAQIRSPSNKASLDPAEKSPLEVSATEDIEKKNFFARRFSGWRGGIALNASLAGAVLLINIIILIWAAAKFKFTNGLTTVFSGDCTKARNLELVAHLFINILSDSYNSVLSSSLAIIDESVILYVTPQYSNFTAQYTPPSWNDAILEKVRERAIAGQLKHVGLMECESALNNILQSKYDSMVFVETSVTYNNSTTLIDSGFNDQNTAFTPEDTVIDCWAGPSEADCELFFNSSLMVAVVVANIIKCVVMVLIVLRFTTPTLVTRGDAIASFLEVEDPTTFNLRSIEKCRFHRSNWIFQDYIPYISTPKRWGSSPSRLKWVFSITACIAFVLTAGGMLALTLVDINLNLAGGTSVNLSPDPLPAPSISSIGFDQPSDIATVDIAGNPAILPQGSNPFQLVLLANTPQLILSTGYLLINNLLTDMVGRLGMEQTWHDTNKTPNHDPTRPTTKHLLPPTPLHLCHPPPNPYDRHALPRLFLLLRHRHRTLPIRFQRHPRPPRQQS
ncbi:hypothetical protein G7Y89_g15139 [Cudoniella acicularis]|uniref:DUF6536 domain-containing protein n=1 Tax=Cudoniella acicularis TaxID=354080 RepID=A0A8H4VQV2_9HELO|nr:hypothetical protein G7Y89_g15139 [Cudoniella acicularis]